MNTENLSPTVQVMTGFDTPDDFHEFVNSKIEEGYVFVRSDAMGSKYKHPDGRRMTVRKDAYDGKVILWV